MAAQLEQSKCTYITIFVNGTKINFSKYDNVKPAITEDRILVPVRALSEALAIISAFQ